MANRHGRPCWYELGTNDLDAAAVFYNNVLGWEMVDSGMEEMQYRLAQSGEDMVAGMMALDHQVGNPPPNWLIYFAVDSAEAASAAVTERGGEIIVPPADIPGTGRFAVLLDPQGAAFGVLQPQPAEGDGPQGGAFNQDKLGHGNWQELMTPAPIDAVAFYADLFGWGKGEAMDMGEMGTYQLFSHDGTDIGGIMAQGDSPVPCWLPYFGVDSIDASMATIATAGGTVIHGPMEVPGGAFVAIAQDPQGAVFAIVGGQ